MDKNDTNCKNCGSYPCLHGTRIGPEHLENIQVGCRLRNEIGGLRRVSDNDGVSLMRKNLTITDKQGDDWSYKYESCFYDYLTGTQNKNKYINEFSFQCKSIQEELVELRKRHGQEGLVANIIYN